MLPSIILSTVVNQASTKQMTEFYSEKIGLPKTDPRRWRLRTDKLGRESWEYLTPEPVSYTHLDVYKRQVLLSGT